MKRVREEGDMQREKKRKKKIEHQNPHLPLDIIYKILLHVPAPKLINCRQIISNNFARANAALAPPCIIFCAVSGSYGRYMTLHLGRRRNHIKELNKSVLFTRQNPLANVIYDSCHGLLLLLFDTPYVDSDVQVFVVANPITRKRWILPQVLEPSNEQPPFQAAESCCRLAFDRSRSEYKLVWLSRGHDGAALKCNIFTVGCSSRKVFDVPKVSADAFTIFQCRPIRCGGVLHWLTGARTRPRLGFVFNSRKEVILSMDVSTQQFRITRHPSEVTGRCHLLELGGFLAIIYRTDTKADIWILVDYEKDIWVKKHAIANKLLIDYLGLPKLRFGPLASTRGGKMILFQSSENYARQNYLYKYDLEDDTFEMVSTHLKYIGKMLSGTYCEHVDSLVGWEEN